MKLGLTICEYNPFHNGHAYSLNKIKENLNPDLAVVIMSGNFTQRGEIALMNKYQRAKHAILAGADIVIELPAVFATAPAELFAKGAVKLLNELQGDKTLCFGVENASKSGLIATATALSNESEDFKNNLKQMLKDGHSLAKAKQLALDKISEEDRDLACDLTPNNILGLEYTKAIIGGGYKMDIMPITRLGAGYKDLDFNKETCSAMAIRQAIKAGEIEKYKNFMPSFVYEDLPLTLPDCDDFIMQALITCEKENLKGIVDCTEGLENRIKDMLKNSFTREELINKVQTRRYTRTRIARITLSALLKIEETFIKQCLKGELYLKVLAIKESKLELLSSLAGKTPFIMRKSDASKLSDSAIKCFNKDVTANDLYNLITKQKTNEFYTQIIK